MTPGTEFDVLQAELRTLSDRNAIRDLISRLGQMLDEQRLEEAPGIFTPDAVGVFGSEQLFGIEDIVTRAAGLASFASVQHVISNVLVDVRKDRATVGANLVATHVHPATDEHSSPDPGKHFDAGCRYEFDTVRTSRGWRIAKVALDVVWLSGERGESSDESQAAPFDPLRPAHYVEPQARVAEARARCPVSEPLPDAYFIASDALVREVMNDPQQFSSLGNFLMVADGDGRFGVDPDELRVVGHDPYVTNCDPPEHTALRRMLFTWFSPPAIRKREPDVRRITDEVLDALPIDRPVDLMTNVATDVPGRVVLGMIGLPDTEIPSLVQWTEVINAHMPGAPEDLPELPRFVEVVSAMVAARRAAGADGDTVTDGLLRVEREDGPLTDADVVTHLMQLIAAGTDTTTSLLGNLIYELLIDRSRWERLQTDRSLVTIAVEESLRHDAPLQWGLRTVLADTTVAETPVRAGNRLVVGLQSANWDEVRWGSDAGEFSLDRRSPQKHASLGVGVHTCLGAPLARLEARVVLERLLDRFPGMRLTAGYSRNPAPGVMVRRPHRLEVELVPE